MFLLFLLKPSFQRHPFLNYPFWNMMSASEKAIGSTSHIISPIWLAFSYPITLAGRAESRCV